MVMLAISRAITMTLLEIHHLLAGAMPGLIKTLLLSLISLIQNQKPPYKDPIQYHTSILSGHQWILKLLSGHLNCICWELGMRKEVFLQLFIELHQADYSN